jgi:hypothetical protein
MTYSHLFEETIIETNHGKLHNTARTPNSKLVVKGSLMYGLLEILGVPKNHQLRNQL